MERAGKQYDQSALGFTFDHLCLCDVVETRQSGDALVRDALTLEIVFVGCIQLYCINDPE